MPTKTKNKQSYPIPLEHQEEIRALCIAESDADIRTDCAKSRCEKAIKEGNAELAIAEKHEGRRLASIYSKAHDDLWARIHEVIPELEEDGNYSVDLESMEIETEGRGHGMPSLARLLAGDN